jgi:hypothetical protein
LFYASSFSDPADPSLPYSNRVGGGRILGRAIVIGRVAPMLKFAKPESNKASLIPNPGLVFSAIPAVCFQRLLSKAAKVINGGAGTAEEQLKLQLKFKIQRIITQFRTR